MLLLYIYVATLVLGGILLGASLVLGHQDSDTDVHADVGADAHVDIGADADAHMDIGTDADAHVDAGSGADFHQLEVGAHGMELSDFWVPFISVRFWVFFLCFFGLTGTVLTLLALAGKWSTLVAAVAVGTVTGFAAAFIIQRLKKAELGTAVTEEDFKGQEATVILPIEKDGKGKVRLEIREQTVDLVARTDEATALERGRKVLVIDMRDNEAVVVPAPELESLTGNGG